jgi:hypothetical protein
VVYLIDGEQLIDICKRNQIGVKKVHLPELLILDPEVARDSGGEAGDNGEFESSGDSPALHRLRDEMLGDLQRGLSAEEVAELSGLAISTVRVYLSDDRKRRALGDRIRGDEQARARALRIVFQRREIAGGQ